MERSQALIWKVRWFSNREPLVLRFCQGVRGGGQAVENTRSVEFNSKNSTGRL